MDLILTCKLRTSYSYTAIYIYYPLWYSVHLELIVLPLKILIFDLLISLISTLLLEWSGFSSCFSPTFSILFRDFVSWDWLLLTEVGNRIRVAQRKRGGFMMCREATWSLFVFSLDSWILLLFPALLNFGDEIFIRWVECNIPYLMILYLSKYLSGSADFILFILYKLDLRLPSIIRHTNYFMILTLILYIVTIIYLLLLFSVFLPWFQPITHYPIHWWSKPYKPLPITLFILDPLAYPILMIYSLFRLI